MALKDFQINSMSELEKEVSDLKLLSGDINELLTKVNATYANQSEGYASANSTRLAESMQECSNKARKITENVDGFIQIPKNKPTRLAESMQECSNKARKIAENVSTIEKSVDKYRQQVKETDEA